MSFTKTTEQESNYQNLDLKSTRELLEDINAEDQSVPAAIRPIIPKIEALVDVIVEKFEQGGRLFYLGAGTSGRLGVVDASECPPTYGVPHGMVVGLIAGGDSAIRKAVEFAEDDDLGGWRNLQDQVVSADDVVVGIAASGTTPYVIGALREARKVGITTGCITCNAGAPVSEHSDHPIEVVVGPEYVTGSTRMKSGTAQKLVLNMLTTASMIRIGRVKGNGMVDMQLSNNKLVDRGTKMVMEALSIGYHEANALLKLHGSVRKAIDSTNR